MPKFTMRANGLTPGEFATNWRLLRACKPQLLARGFRPDMQVEIERSGEYPEAQAVITQEPAPGRMRNDDPAIGPLLQEIKYGNSAVIGKLAARLSAAGDDRADYLLELEVALVEDVEVYADHGTTQEGHSDRIVSQASVAARQLCERVLVLFGLRD